MVKRTLFVISADNTELLSKYNASFPVGVELSIGKVLNDLLAQYLVDRLADLGIDANQQ